MIKVYNNSKKSMGYFYRIMISHFYRLYWKITLALIYLVDICYINIDTRHQ